jgi:hypothetical protein
MHQHTHTLQHTQSGADDVKEITKSPTGQPTKSPETATPSSSPPTTSTPTSQPTTAPTVVGTTLQPTGAPTIDGIVHASGCEGDLLKLSCQRGTFLKIDTAHFGRLDKDACHGGLPVCPFSPGDVTSIIAERCDGERECKLRAETGWLNITDPCFGAFKVFTANYRCLNSEDIPVEKIVNTETISASSGFEGLCANSFLHLKCQDPDHVIVSVNATFGTSSHPFLFGFGGGGVFFASTTCTFHFSFSSTLSTNMPSTNMPCTRRARMQRALGLYDVRLWFGDFRRVRRHRHGLL